MSKCTKELSSEELFLQTLDKDDLLSRLSMAFYSINSIYQVLDNEPEKEEIESLKRLCHKCLYDWIFEGKPTGLVQ